MSKIDERLMRKLDELLGGHQILGMKRNEYGLLDSIEDLAACQAWIASVINTVENMLPEGNAYRRIIRQLSEDGSIDGAAIYNVVIKISSVLEQLIGDAREGLLINLAEAVRAETFVEFLEHGRAYLREKRQVSGVIVGVVFEDTVRRICEKNLISQTGRPLENLISELQKVGKLTAVQAQRARAAAAVRTKATHAQWEEFKLSDVEATLTFTEELIEQHLS